MTRHVRSHIKCTAIALKRPCFFRKYVQTKPNGAYNPIIIMDMYNGTLKTLLKFIAVNIRVVGMCSTANINAHRTATPKNKILRPSSDLTALEKSHMKKDTRSMFNI